MKKFKSLGKKTKLPTKPSINILETFDNAHPNSLYLVPLVCHEFTSICPITGQPDFATLELEYVPDRTCVELKSLKLYLWSFRNEGHFHEDVTNRILNDLVAATNPRYLRLRARFNVRGGIYTSVTVEHRQPGWNPPPAGLPRQTAGGGIGLEHSHPASRVRQRISCGKPGQTAAEYDYIALVSGHAAPVRMLSDECRRKGE